MSPRRSSKPVRCHPHPRPIPSCSLSRARGFPHRRGHCGPCIRSAGKRGAGLRVENSSVAGPPWGRIGCKRVRVTLSARGDGSAWPPASCATWSWCRCPPTTRSACGLPAPERPRPTLGPPCSPAEGQRVGKDSLGARGATAALPASRLSRQGLDASLTAVKTRV